MKEKDGRWKVGTGKEGIWKGRRVIRVEEMKERKMHNNTKDCKREWTDGQMDRQSDGEMDGRIDEQKKCNGKMNILHQIPI